jgi:gamma-glutamylaminecyclotransferase
VVLFLYGSLKRGHSNHWRVAGQEYLGEAVTEPRYRILDLGTYPGMVRDDAAGLAVRGKLWAVDARCLAALDEYEQAEGLWLRRPVAVAGREGVEAYLWVGEVPDGVRSGNEWPFPYSPSTSAIV